METDRITKVMRSISSPPVIPLASSHQLTENTKFLTCMAKSEEMESVSSPQQTKGTEDDHEQPMTPHLSEPSSSPSTSPKGEIKSTDSANKLAKRESYKAQRKNYRREKKRVARELLSTLKDPSIIILADWLKVRGTLKGWTKLWCVLKPSLLLLYKSPKTHKSSQWVGTVLLNACELIERPSKKDGFCFKLFHPLEQSIWASKGPQGEAIGALVQPLPMTHLIFRAPSEAAGKCWMDGLELALRCPSLLIRSMSGSEGKSLQHEISQDIPFRQQSNQWNESDIEKHFNDPGCLNSSSACSCQCPNPSCQLHIYRRYSCPHPPKSVETTNSSSKHCPAVIISTPEENRRLSLDSLQNTYESPKTSSPCPAQHYLHKTNNKKTLSNPELTESEKHNNASQAELVFKVLSSASASLTPVLSPASSSSFHSDFEEDIHTDDNREIDPEGRHSYHSTDSDSDPHPDDSDPRQEDEEEIEPVETPYVENGEEEFGLAGDAGQTEEVADENKGLIWSLVKQVRPGMDLSKVVLPTFILEPRSFLDKLSDYYYHSDIISRAVLEDDPFTRMKTVVQWYLSGFYKKPKGLKKPYNPILGETFRCYWKHPNTGSRTFYIAEQVSHHPPVSAFYVTNRQDGFCICGSILAKSKFYGNSLSAILDGTARLSLLTRGEDYTLTMPYAHCKGILMGTLTMELGGKVNICCEKTGYSTELEFKLRPIFGGSELCNLITGKIKLGKETLATIEGHWDNEIYFRDKRTGEERLFWNPNSEIRASRLKRYTVPVVYQEEFESERLWQHVSAAILRGDQIAATEEKTILEEAQRKAAKERQIKLEKWTPKLFLLDLLIGGWIYKHADTRPWDPRNDVLQYEYNYIIQTKTRHRTPVVRTSSIVSGGEELSSKKDLLHMSVEHVITSRPSKCFLQENSVIHHRPSVLSHGSESSSPDVEVIQNSDSTESNGSVSHHRSGKPSTITVSLKQCLEPLLKIQEETNQTLQSINNHLESVMAQQHRIQEQLAQRNDISIIIIFMAIQLLFHWLL
ncbi:oxysterol-binding protein-related protein 8 isoform X2 [Centruroides vittatus]|uniref:oxysterol-binding protein-related protein 8 isoform X2 n=1 Tax=Centruroides vittatus TaxID=120091 RepID=UPI0035102511